MRLVDYNHRVLVLYLESLPYFLIDQIVVRHENEICGGNTVLRGIVGAVLVLESRFMDVFDIGGLTRHLSLSDLPVLEIRAWV